MPLYGWDSSHFDGDLTRTILQRAKDEGIAFWTHKIGEGLDNTDPRAAAAFAAAHAVGFKVVGGYYFIHHGQDMVAQARRCVALADQQAPWWRDFPGWFWQTDAENEQGFGLPTPAEVKQFSDTLADLTGRTVIVYASAGQYGDRLAGLGHKLWNANYGSDPVGGFKALYPGDGYRGWRPYSGQTPVLLQYSSKATIAGLATCDANAYRGTLDDLLEEIMATVDITDASQHAVAEAVLSTSGTVPNIATDPDFATLPKTALNTAIYRIRQASADARDSAAAAVAALNAANASLAGIVKTEAAIQATLATMANAESVDTATLAAQIKAVGDTESAAVAGLQAQNAQLLADVAQLQAAVAALSGEQPPTGTGVPQQPSSRD